MYTYRFDHVSASDIGEWDGQEERAAVFLNRVLDELSRQATTQFPDPTETQRLAIEDLGKHVIFESLCNTTDFVDRHGRKIDPLDQDDADVRIYVGNFLRDYVEG